VAGAGAQHNLTKFNPREAIMSKFTIKKLDALKPNVLEEEIAEFEEIIAFWVDETEKGQKEPTEGGDN